MSEFEAYRAEIEAAERKVAGEIQPGARAMVVAILVFVLLVSLILLAAYLILAWFSARERPP